MGSPARIVRLTCPKCGNRDDVTAPAPECSAGCGTKMQATHVAITLDGEGSVTHSISEYTRRVQDVVDAGRKLLAGRGTIADLKAASDKLAELEPF